MLKELLKEAMGWGLRCSGLGAALRAVFHRRRALVLVYHDPEAGVLTRHLNWLAGRYRFIPIETVVHAVESGDWSRVPRRALAVTFDDGHRGNAALCGVLSRFDVQPVIYLCSQIVDSSRHFWWTEVPEDAERLKTLSFDDFLARMSETTGYRPDKSYEDRQALDRAELAALAPHASFGGHTRFHPILPRCSDAVARKEISGSRDELERMLGHTIDHFAYPNGDYGPRDVALVREAGYRSARTIQAGWNGPGTDPYELRATCVEDDASLNVLALRVSGVLIPFVKLRKIWQRLMPARRRS